MADEREVQFVHNGKIFNLEIKNVWTTDFGQKRLSWSEEKGWHWRKEDNVTKFYDKLGVGVIELKGNLKVGDKVHIQGTQDDFEQMVESMQLDHKDVKSGKKGNLVAVKVDSPVHKNDKVSVVGK